MNKIGDSHDRQIVYLKGMKIQNIWWRSGRELSASAGLRRGGEKPPALHILPANTVGAVVTAPTTTIIQMFLFFWWGNYFKLTSINTTYHSRDFIFSVKTEF
ncbi:unnamed protein product [Parnassius mnemosyne]|uniref:Uncharacterized protein n=1 Tax=Parnassius mnemosyne TaxID=213953 RepID=A0AAV1K958_9NEOP